MTTTFVARPGSIVAWRNGEGLSLAVACGEEKQRVRLVLVGGREARVPPARVLFEVETAGEVPGTDVQGRRAAGERVERVERQVNETAKRVDVALLWEIIVESQAAETVRPPTLGELADLALEASDGAARAAMLRALIDDGLHFIRKAEDFIARDRRSVEDLRAERERVARREVEGTAFLAALARTVRGAAYVACGTDVERHYLDALEHFALHDDAAPEALRALALRALEASGLRFDRPHEGAFRLLRLTGRFTSDDLNLPILRFGLRTEFLPEVEDGARASAARGFLREGRTDRTALEILSIDGPHTREIDDALSLESLHDDTIRLGVHIADPTPFVEPGGSVDAEAQSRGLSYYMPDVRLPMLPAAISEDAASLVAGADRPALSFFVELDAGGEILGFAIERSVVRSAAHLDYAEADRIIAAAEGAHAALLAGLARVGWLRQEARCRAGAVLIVNREVEVHVLDDGRLELERIEADSASRRAVSEAMILAGEVAARFCRDRGLPVGYRRQAPPDGALDLPADGARDPVAVRRTRMALKRGEVGLEPGRHASLGLEAYAQVTSPLRRYQDLAAHRQIGAALEGRAPFHDVEAMRRILATTERAEAEARRAERDADSFWILRYLERQVGSEVEAVVVQVVPRPVVQLVDTLREQPMNGLTAVAAGEVIRLRVERVNPRAGLLVLRRVG